jgi:hypothetical protein
MLTMRMSAVTSVNCHGKNMEYVVVSDLTIIIRLALIFF